jgi:hypothetical protein
MLGANLDSVSSSKGTLLSDVLDRMILIGVALSAPILAMITGHLTAVEWKTMQRERSNRMARYEEQLTLWRSGLNAAWASSKGKYGVGIRVEREQLSSPIVPMERPLERDGQGSGKGFQRNPTATEILEQHLADHPEDLMIDPRDLARKLNVGKSSAYAVVGRMRGQKDE